MVFPQLHIEIGLVNNVLDSFSLFIDDQVEAPTDEEKCSRNSYIIADVALTKAIKQLDEWKEVDGHNLQGYRDEAAQLRNSLKRSGAMNEGIRTKRGSQRVGTAGSGDRPIGTRTKNS